MAEHEVVSEETINKYHAHDIKSLADSIWDKIDDALQDMGENMTHVCDEFLETADCEKCIDTMDKTKDRILKLVFDNMIGADS